MMFRMTIRGAALALGLLASPGFAPQARACEGSECQQPAKPLDLKKFMREQAASTRTHEAMRTTRGQRVHKPAQKSARVHHPAQRRIVTAKAKPDDAASHAASDAASAYAAQDDAAPVQASADINANVQVVSSGELNDIDRAAPPPAETQGLAPADDRKAQGAPRDVQVVVENAFDDIDSKSARVAQSMAKVAAASNETTPQSGPAATSWMQWLWSAIGAGFVVLAGLARYLFA